MQINLFVLKYNRKSFELLNISMFAQILMKIIIVELRSLDNCKFRFWYFSVIPFHLSILISEIPFGILLLCLTNSVILPRFAHLRKYNTLWLACAIFRNFCRNTKCPARFIATNTVRSWLRWDRKCSRISLGRPTKLSLVTIFREARCTYAMHLHPGWDYFNREIHPWLW